MPESTSETTRESSSSVTDGRDSAGTHNSTNRPAPKTQATKKVSTQGAFVR